MRLPSPGGLDALYIAKRLTFLGKYPDALPISSGSRSSHPATGRWRRNAGDRPARDRPEGRGDGPHESGRPADPTLGVVLDGAGSGTGGRGEARGGTRGPPPRDRARPVPARDPDGVRQRPDPRREEPGGVVRLRGGGPAGSASSLDAGRARPASGEPRASPGGDPGPEAGRRSQAPGPGLVPDARLRPEAEPGLQGGRRGLQGGDRSSSRTTPSSTTAWAIPISTSTIIRPRSTPTARDQGGREGADYRKNLANTLRLAGRRAEAIEAYQTVIDLCARDSGWPFRPGRMLLQIDGAGQGHRGPAEGRGSEPESTPRPPGCWASTSACTGGPGTPSPGSMRRSSSAPTGPAPTRHRGRTLGQLGRHEDAIRSLRRAGELLQNDSDQVGWQVEHDLGIGLGEAGRFAEGLVALRRSKELAAKIGPPEALSDELRQMMGSLDGLVRQSERLAELDATLSGIRAGTVAAANPASALELANFAHRPRAGRIPRRSSWENGLRLEPRGGRRPGRRAPAGRGVCGGRGLGRPRGRPRQLDPSEKARLRNWPWTGSGPSWRPREGIVRDGPPGGRAGVRAGPPTLARRSRPGRRPRPRGPGPAPRGRSGGLAGPLGRGRRPAGQGRGAPEAINASRAQGAPKCSSKQA